MLRNKASLLTQTENVALPFFFSLKKLHIGFHGVIFLGIFTKTIVPAEV